MTLSNRLAKHGKMDRSANQTKTVVFICTGNYFRSRFSEHVFNALAAQKGLRWQATSRGLQTWLTDNLGPISQHTIAGLAERQLPLSEPIRFPIQLSQDDLETADLVIALKKAEHHAMMVEQFPDWAERIEYWQIDDLDCALPDETLAACEACLVALVERLAGEDSAANDRRTAA